MAEVVLDDPPLPAFYLHWAPCGTRLLMLSAWPNNLVALKAWDIGLALAARAGAGAAVQAATPAPRPRRPVLLGTARPLFLACCPTSTRWGGCLVSWARGWAGRIALQRAGAGVVRGRQELALCEGGRTGQRGRSPQCFSPRLHRVPLCLPCRRVLWQGNGLDYCLVDCATTVRAPSCMLHACSNLSKNPSPCSMPLHPC